jgi:hypothetical protein
MGMGVILESKPLVFQHISVHLDLRFIFSELFQKNAVISLEVFVDPNSSFCRSIAEMFVVMIFTLDRTEDRTLPSVQFIFAYFTFSQAATH